MEARLADGAPVSSEIPFQALLGASRLSSPTCLTVTLFQSGQLKVEPNERVSLETVKAALAHLAQIAQRSVLFEATDGKAFFAAAGEPVRSL